VTDHRQAIRARQRRDPNRQANQSQSRSTGRQIWDLIQL